MYDYDQALDKVMTSYKSKNALPFRRKIIDYSSLNRIIDVKDSGVKANLKGKKLRRHLNKEDDVMIYNLVIQPSIEKQKADKLEKQKKLADLYSLLKDYQEENPKIREGRFMK